MTRKNQYKKIFVIAAALIVFFAPVGIAMENGPIAQNFSGAHSLSLNFYIANAASGSAQPNFFIHPITGPVYYVATVIDQIMSLAVMGTAALVRLGLQFNDNIFNSPAVQTGFSVSLAIANLGFVLGIIIIALATILRNQTYGIKQLLWKLVFMAILVNFGLVITAPIVGFAGSMSNFFINATSPSNTTGGYEGYVTTMAQAFAPQAVGSGVQQAGCANAAAGTGVAAICNTAQTTAKKEAASDSFTQSLLALVFGIVFLAVTAFTFLCLAILLIIRYLMLGGLLIVLPLAWLTWIFPKFDNSYSKWWNTFVKWTFFPPLALFFIYLAFTTATNVGKNTYLQQAAGIPQGASSGVEAALAYQTGLGGPIQQAADEVLLVGLMIMGLMFSLSLTGKAGSTVVNGAGAVSKAAAGYVGKKGLRIAGRTVPQKLKENLQAGKVLPFGQRLQVAAGVGLGNLERKGRGDMVAEEAKNAEALAKQDPQAFARVLSNESGAMGTGGTSKQRQMAMLAQLAKDEDLMKEFKKQGSVVGGVEIQKFLQDNEGEFKRLQQGKIYETLKDKSGLSLVEASQKSQTSEKTMLELGGKAKLQEVKDIKARAASGETVNESDRRKVNEYTQRKQDLEWNESHPDELESPMTDAEKGELTEIRTMETTPGKYMSDDEKATYEKAKESYIKSASKIKELVAKDPDTVASNFQNYEKAAAILEKDKKPVPLSLDPSTAKQIQKSIITAMAEGFSPQNAKGLIEAIGKKNNLKYFEDAMDKMDAKTAAQIKQLAASNKPFATWVRNNPGRNIVDLNQMFGVRPKRKKKNNGGDNDES